VDLIAGDVVDADHRQDLSTRTPSNRVRALAKALAAEAWRRPY
jgi:hypothetical protein